MPLPGNQAGASDINFQSCRRSTEQLIWEDILQGFANWTDIDFAYPTQ
jgi:hypothetical protein